MRILTLAILIIGCFGVVANASPQELVLPHNESTIEQDLARVVACLDTSGVAYAWVFFTDKGIYSPAELEVAVGQAKHRLSSRSLARRVKAKGEANAVDFRDVPVHYLYVDAIASTGAKIRHVLHWFNAVTVEATLDQLTAISRFPFVHRLRPLVRRLAQPLPEMGPTLTSIPFSAVTLNYGPSQQQLEQINGIVAHELGFAGQDVLVCMMDTGYKLGHQAFASAISQGRLLAQYDFINHDFNTDYEPGQDDPNQPFHGTLTWSTLGGFVPGQLIGPAYEARFCLAKTEDITGEHHWEEDNWAAGAQWADSIGADVISSSLGYRFDFTPPDSDYAYEDMNGDSTIVTQAADLAVYNGIVVVTAMGNDGWLGAGSLIAPADGDSVIACGAVDEYDGVAGFSARGPTYDGRIKPEICARGVATVCADPDNLSAFRTASGTSLSTPLAGGTAAVLLSAHPNWTPVMVREALQMTASRHDQPDNSYGRGIIDLGAALFYHPQGDIIIDHEPLIQLFVNQSQVTIRATISGGMGINPQACLVYFRPGGTGFFTPMPLTTIDNLHYLAMLSVFDSVALEYYLEAADVSGAIARLPFDAPRHFFSIQPGAACFVDSFEMGLYYWISSAVRGGWSVTTEYAASGNLSVADSPFRQYRANLASLLTSKFVLDLRWVDSASVAFRARYDLQTNRDFVYLEVSTDGGGVWQSLGQPITGSSGQQFTLFSYSLASLLGCDQVCFRFRMTTDVAGARDGIYIDDFTLTWHPTTGVTDQVPILPSLLQLAPSYPNPFNSSTVIRFSIPVPSAVELVIYDVAGRHLRRLWGGYWGSLDGEVVWDGRDDNGTPVASGIYLCRLRCAEQTTMRKITLLK